MFMQYLFILLWHLLDNPALHHIHFIGHRVHSLLVIWYPYSLSQITSTCSFQCSHTTNQEIETSSSYILEVVCELQSFFSFIWHPHFSHYHLSRARFLFKLNNLNTSHQDKETLRNFLLLVLFKKRCYHIKNVFRQICTPDNPGDKDYVFSKF